MGGGRKYMTPRGTKDPEYPWNILVRGQRKDGRDLTKEWQSMKAGKVKRNPEKHRNTPKYDDMKSIPDI